MDLTFNFICTWFPALFLFFAVCEVIIILGHLLLHSCSLSFYAVLLVLISLSDVIISLFQIVRYKLVMEGEYKVPDVFAAGKSNNVSSPLSWSSLLKGSAVENRIPQSLSYYVKFYLRYAKELEGLTWPSELQSHESEAAMDLRSTSDVKSNPADAWKGKEFNIALITHKFPARRKVFYHRLSFCILDADASKFLTEMIDQQLVLCILSAVFSRQEKAMGF